ncbi:unnamed protein product [Amoebophrya sp. A25]|nr:unnamed protein product [Amoebophrya sp. A25]|eukprot:GSA25T00027130001.1
MVYGLLIHAHDGRAFFSIFWSAEGNDSRKRIRQQAVIRRVVEECTYQKNFFAPAAEGRHRLLEGLFGVTRAERIQDATRRKNGSSLDLSFPSALFGSGLFGSSRGQKDNDLFPHDERTLLSSGDRAQYDESSTRCALPGRQQEGVLRMGSQSLFETSKVIVWKQVGDVYFTLICEPLENSLLARNFLTLFIAELHRHFESAKYDKKDTKETIGGQTAASPEQRPKGKSEGGMDEHVSQRPDEVLMMLHYLLPGGQLLFSSYNLHNFLVKGHVTEALAE